MFMCPYLWAIVHVGPCVYAYQPVTRFHQIEQISLKGNFLSFHLFHLFLFFVFPSSSCLFFTFHLFLGSGPEGVDVL